MQKNQKLLFHLTSKTPDQTWFKKPISTMWHELCSRLEVIQNTYDADIISFLLMNNHFHLLIKTSVNDLHCSIKHLKPQTFQNQKIQHLSSRTYLYHAYRYIYQNPIRANLVKRVEDYPYSSLYDIWRGQKPPFSIIDRFGILDDYKLHLLNQPITKEQSFKVKNIDAFKPTSVV